MSKYKLTFKLKQHTPIIHFQHDQHGATLRATELKPKLDRFLIKKLKLTQIIQENGKDKEVPKDEYKNWFINQGKEHLALDYKVRVKSNNRNREFDDLIDVWKEEGKDKDGNPKEKLKYKNLPNFFGNMMKVKEFKNGNKKIKKVTIHNDIQVELQCFNLNVININNQAKTLLEVIKDNFAEFLASTNFGTRQSKGFGSFYIHPEDENYLPINYNLYFTLDIKETEFKKLFEAIELFYRSIKSGLNIKTRDKKSGNIIDKMYLKSLLFHYAKDLNPSQQWDKRTIRHALYINDWKYNDQKNRNGILQKRKDKDGTVHFTAEKPDNGKYYDFRDLLGLSTEQEWRYYKDKHITKSVSKEIQDKIYTIDRFKSPILIKPIFENNTWYIYLYCFDIPKEYIEANVIVKNNSKQIELTIFPNFKPCAYLKYAIKKFDAKDIVFSNNFNKDNCNEAATIIKIFDSLKNQVKK